jgi:hypothetical protein
MLAASTAFFDMVRKIDFISGKTLLINILGSIAIITHGNKSVGAVPCFDLELKRHENIFSVSLMEYILDVTVGILTAELINIGGIMFVEANK